MVNSEFGSGARNPVGIGGRIPNSKSLLLDSVLRVGDLIHPFRLAAEADVDLHERLAGHRAVPVDDVRSRVVALADAEFLDRLPPLLRAQAPFFDHQELTL